MADKKNKDKTEIIDEYLEERLKYSLAFNRDGPFFDLVTAFLVANVGLKPLLEKITPKDDTMKELERAYPAISWLSIGLGGKGFPGVTIRPFELYERFNALKVVSHGDLMCSFCSMLIIMAYESHKKYFDDSPIFEFLRHIRNACAHDNKFYFNKHEPRREARWKELKIDHKIKGEKNSLFGTECFFKFMGSADPVFLLNDVENYWREIQTKEKMSIERHVREKRRKNR